jgi:hypothetical protein
MTIPPSQPPPKLEEEINLGVFMINEQQRRWRLLLGNTANLTPELSATDMGMDAALAALYNQGEGEEDGMGNGSKSKSTRGGLGSSAPKVSRWLAILGSTFRLRWCVFYKKMPINALT